MWNLIWKLYDVFALESAVLKTGMYTPRWRRGKQERSTCSTGVDLRPLLLLLVLGLSRLSPWLSDLDILEVDGPSVLPALRAAFAWPALLAAGTSETEP